MKRTLKEVKHILDLKRNLLSLGTLDKSSYNFKVENGKLTISKGVMVFMKGQKRNGLYILEGHTLKGLVGSMLRIETDKTILWHRRLGHLSDWGLKELHKQGLLCGDNINKIDFCQYCILGKQHRLAFKVSIHKSKDVLEYVHLDLWGTTRVSTYGGNRYFLSLIDDYSRKAWLYLLNTKDEHTVLTKVKEWKALVENQTNKRVKVLKTDNGLEFCNEQFEMLYKNQGISRHKIVRNTPQRNGLE